MRTDAMRHGWAEAVECVILSEFGSKFISSLHRGLWAPGQEASWLALTRTNWSEQSALAEQQAACASELPRWHAVSGHGISKISNPNP